jgi:hypothetical protein
LFIPQNKHLSVAPFTIFVMASRFFASAFVAMLLVLGVSAVAGSDNAYAQGDDLWYPGEGVKQDMYVKYRIQELDTNDKQPFEMTLYFQEQDAEGDWIVPTFVVDEGNVIEGTFKLSESMTYLSGGSTVPAEMSDFVGGYSGSLHWLDSFTTKSDPKSLTAANWGRTGSIGGSDVKPITTETIQVQAGTFDTTRVELHKGQVDSKIWILNEFPFPIKAEFYTDTTTGTPEIQFAFELLETGTGKPEVPQGQAQVPTPPLEGRSGRGDFVVTLDWEPATIGPGQTVLFTVSLADRTEFPLERANYDFVVTNSSGGVVAEFKNQNADAELGTGTHEVQFNDAGGMTVTVTINSISGVGTGQFTENVAFRIVVVPEFPLGVALIVASLLALIVGLVRVKGTALGGLFGGKNI